MATKKKTDVEPPPGAPQVRRQLSKLAKIEASRVTGIPVAQIKRGRKPTVALKTTNKKKGTK